MQEGGKVVFGSFGLRVAAMRCVAGAGMAVACVALLGSGVSSAAAGSGWSIQVTPNPVADSLLNGVSCSLPRACTAVGTSLIGSVASRALVVRWDGRRWKPQVTPKPRVDSVLVGVSCPHVNVCVAVGSGGRGSLVERWNGRRWRIQASGSGRSGDLAAVSCSSPSACTAVGLADDGQKAFVERWNGIRWVVQHLQTPAGFLIGVSCPSATDCTAVGNSYPPGSTFAEQ